MLTTRKNTAFRPGVLECIRIHLPHSPSNCKSQFVTKINPVSIKPFLREMREYIVVVVAYILPIRNGVPFPRGMLIVMTFSESILTQIRQNFFIHGGPVYIKFKPPCPHFKKIAPKTATAVGPKKPHLLKSKITNCRETTKSLTRIKSSISSND